MCVVCPFLVHQQIAQQGGNDYGHLTILSDQPLVVTPVQYFTPYSNPGSFLSLNNTVGVIWLKIF